MAMLPQAQEPRDARARREGAEIRGAMAVIAAGRLRGLVISGCSASALTPELVAEAAERGLSLTSEPLADGLAVVRLRRVR